MLFADRTSCLKLAANQFRLLLSAAAYVLVEAIRRLCLAGTPLEKAQVTRMLERSIVGSPRTVREGIEALIAETAADELIIVSDVYDHEQRLRSFELIVEAYPPLQRDGLP